MSNLSKPPNYITSPTPRSNSTSNGNPSFLRYEKAILEFVKIKIAETTKNEQLGITTLKEAAEHINSIRHLTQKTIKALRKETKLDEQIDSSFQLEGSSILTNIKLDITNMQRHNFNKKDENKVFKMEVDKDYIKYKHKEVELLKLKRAYEQLKNENANKHDIELLPEEKFDKEAPEKLKEGSEDPHKKFKSRLKFEYAQRRQTDKDRRELISEKNKIKAQTSKFVSDISKIKAHANNLLISNEATVLKDSVKKLRTPESQQPQTPAQLKPEPKN